jgi:hypothetical protein
MKIARYLRFRAVVEEPVRVFPGSGKPAPLLVAMN